MGTQVRRTFPKAIFNQATGQHHESCFKKWKYRNDKSNDFLRFVDMELPDLDLEPDVLQRMVRSWSKAVASHVSRCLASKLGPTVVCFIIVKAKNPNLSQDVYKKRSQALLLAYTSAFPKLGFSVAAASGNVAHFQANYLTVGISPKGGHGAARMEIGTSFAMCCFPTPEIGLFFDC